MGVHFIRLTGQQVVFLRGALIDWEGEFNYSTQNQELVAFVNTLRSDLFGIHVEDSENPYVPTLTEPPLPNLANQDHVKTHSEDPESGYDQGFTKVMDKVIEVNGWFDRFV